jgi:outer membrane protein TolC
MRTSCRRALTLALVFLPPLFAGAGTGTRPPFRTGASPEHDGERAGGVFDGRPVERISLDKAITMAVANNLDARIERTGIRIAQSRVRFAAGAFDPVFSIRTTRESLRRLENVNDIRSADVVRQQNFLNDQFALTQAQINLQNSLREQQGLPLIPALSRQETTTGFTGVTFDAQTSRNTSSLEGRTPWGMRYGFEVEALRLRNTFSGDARRIFPEYQTFAGLTVVQPLLRNFGPAANLAELRIARQNRKSQELEWRDKLAAAVQGVMATYFDMLFSLADMSVRRDAVAADENLVRQNQQRLEVGFAQPFDVQQARAQVSLDEEQYLAAKNSFMERQYLLKRLILGEFDLHDTRVFMPVETGPLPVPKLDRSAFLRDAFANRPEFQQALVQADAEDVRVRFAYNQLLPQLDVIATYGVNGLSGTYEASFDRAFRGHEPSWVVGLNLQIPLMNIQARARRDEALASQYQAVLRIKQMEHLIGNEVDTVITRIAISRQRVETARNTRALNEEAVRIVYRRLEEGQLSTFDVIEQQRKLYDAKSRELAAIADLNKAITQLWLVTGTVLDKAGLHVAPPR